MVKKTINMGFVFKNCFKNNYYNTAVAHYGTAETRSIIPLRILQWVPNSLGIKTQYPFNAHPYPSPLLTQTSSAPVPTWHCMGEREPHTNCSSNMISMFLKSLPTVFLWDSLLHLLVCSKFTSPVVKTPFCNPTSTAPTPLSIPLPKGAFLP